MSRRWIGAGALATLALVTLMLAGAPARAAWTSDDADTTLARRDSSAVAAPDSLPGGAAPAARAPGPLERFLGTLSDSTDRRFGAVAAPIDTAGFGMLLAVTDLDSLARRRRPLPFGWSPMWRYDRTTGNVPGLGITLGSARRTGQLAGDLDYAFVSREWYGRGEARRRWGPAEEGTHWWLRAGAGREVGSIDRDDPASLLTSVWAFYAGADGRSYLRRDGASASVERESPTLRLRLETRAELESPRVTATTWNLTHRALEREPNTAARLARIREAGATGTWRLPWSAWWIETGVHQGVRALAGDLAYTRTRAALGGQLGLGRWATLVPQATYGRLEGDLAPQDAFWLGGSSSLRSIPTDSWTGQRKAFGRLELFGAPDLLALARIPHPALLDVFAAAQVASGAVWGADPLGGPARDGHAWPARSGWLSEAGFSLMYRPGLPDPQGFVRFDWAHGIGADAHRERWSMQFSLPFDQLHPPRR